MEAAQSNKTPPPSLLVEYWHCQEFGTLPGAGGVDNQDYVRFYRMRALDTVYDAVKATKPTAAQEKVVLWLVEVGAL